MSALKQKIIFLLRPVAGEHEPDKKLITTVGIIIIFGLVMLSSASAVKAYSIFGSTYYYFVHQLFGLAIGLLAFWFFSRADYHVWRKYAFWFLIVSVVLLLLVFIPGLSAHYGKARSWINIFGYSLQPSEFVKISFLLYLAAWLETRQKKLDDFSQGIGPFTAVLGVIAGLMILQPDIGTLFIISITSLIVYFVGGGKLKHIFTILLIGALCLVALLFLKPYQMNRFKCMADPSFSSNDICYQVNQSLIAVGSGGLFGRGLGQSRQKFMYLPEVQGDSIFAIIGEEIGLIFSSVLVFLYVYLFYRGYLISKNAPDGFGRILAIGIVTWLVMQAIINIGGMINLMPMTGVPLPFISYGGSAILAALIAMGILVNISKQTR
ncbi:MAG: putative lipid II flippase FtsW [Patescibacteria group bacterium]|nr:putative lipid II flippase FtsW [Patescibacteria group bacterium]MDD4611256.1 putative lipid II flippase FtsW [Patescibacteria group bacterium]